MPKLSTPKTPTPALIFKAAFFMSSQVHFTVG